MIRIPAQVLIPVSSFAACDYNVIVLLPKSGVKVEGDYILNLYRW